MSAKPDDFAERLFVAVAMRRDRAFQWGVHDCCTFACDVIRDAGGVDYAAQLRGRYRTAAGAARVLKRFVAGSRRLARPAAPPGHRSGVGLAGRTNPKPDHNAQGWRGGAAGRGRQVEPSPDKSLLEAAVEKITQDNGLEEVPPLMAQRGDFVLVDRTAGPGLGGGRANRRNPALGVCLGETFVAAGPAGAVTLPLKRARRAWRV